MTCAMITVVVALSGNVTEASHERHCYQRMDFKRAAMVLRQIKFGLDKKREIKRISMMKKEGKG